MIERASEAADVLLWDGGNNELPFVDPDLALAGTPHDLGGVIEVDVPVVRVQYRVAPKDWSVAGLFDDHAEELGL